MVLELARRQIYRDPKIRTPRKLRLPGADVATSRLEHELPERHNQPGRLRQWNEAGRPNESAHRMLPAHERLHLHNVPRAKRDDRLIIDLEFATLEPMPHRCFELEPIQGIA